MNPALTPTGEPNITHGDNGQCVGVPVRRPDGQKRFVWTHVPSCRIGQVFDRLPSPRDEFDYLAAAPYGYEPAEQAERMPS